MNEKQNAEQSQEAQAAGSELKGTVGPPPEYGWLLERNQTPNGPEYLCVEGPGEFGWTTDSLKALRLARRQDGEALALIIEDAWRIAEHQWG